MSFLSRIFRKSAALPKEQQLSDMMDPSTDSSAPMSSSKFEHPQTLSTQYTTRAPAATKIRLSILSTALVDALGGPAEFQDRFTFPFVMTMQPNENFALPAGVWTDDTSMTLCLARSLATYKSTATAGDAIQGGFSELDQLEAYRRWQHDGVLSATGRCFDIGNTIGRAISIYQKHSESIDVALHHIQESLGGERWAGNGSMMRVLPVGLAYWRDSAAASQFARRSSQATHPNQLCLEACELWTQLIVKTMQASCSGDPLPSVGLSKLDLLDHIATFRYTNEKLRDALTVPNNSPSRPTSGVLDLEEYYRRYHPLLLLIDETQKDNSKNHRKEFPYCIPSSEKLPSTGYVLHSLVAALYCFLATNTFSEGAMMAVNLGNDADTVGAIYGGLAGCWYAAEGNAGKNVFWTKRVKEWKKDLVKKDLVQEVAEELVQFSERLGKVSQ